MDFNPDLLISTLAFSASAVLTIASAVIFRASPTKNDKSAYEDSDGKASEESLSKYSVRTQNILLTFISIAGFAISLSWVLLQRFSHEQDAKSVEASFYVGAWALLVLQRAQSLRVRHPVSFHHLTGIEALTSSIIAVAYVLTLFFVFRPKSQLPSLVTKALLCTTTGLSAVGCIVAISIPRRPVVYYETRPVDGQWTVSIFSCLTFGWASEFLAKTATQKKLTFDDFPALIHTKRARTLYDRFNSMLGHGRGMLAMMCLSFLPSLCVSYILTVLESIIVISPQYGMYTLLRLLEARDAGADITVEAAFWVVFLALAIIASGLNSNHVWWVGIGSISVPIRAQLSAVIFAKAMRRKDVKGTSGEEKSTGDVANLTAEQLETVPEKEDPNKTLEENLQKSRQGVVNLIGVDTKRISDFSTFNNMFLGSACNLIVTFTFLGRLVGWQALLAGLAGQLLFLPINIFYSKKYTNEQDILMKLRDRKLAVLNEALNGIRQIKFGALEHQWQAKILDVREEELSVLWKTFIYDTILIGLWLTGPVVLSAAVIAVYAIIYGSLPPSIAFTTISLLSQIEGTLAWLPELTTNMLDAYVSLKRIGEYLEGPEKTQITEPGENIEFQDSVIAWPADVSKETDAPAAEERFTLQALNLSFPRNELSIITGRTGSGKSLLLAAILGEVDLLSGIITVPSPPSKGDRQDDKANKSNWLLPTALAFVSQQPWIENESFKNNVTFGLPMDKDRYREVISACALDKDLDILTDRDETEIGASGINLSGGQRWRITLARALYSRAGILVLDDIFSAVDTHVGRHIYEEAIMGPLCKGRTVILVTHHAGLVRDGAKYEVRLADGTVEYAGKAQDDDDALIIDEENLEPTAKDRAQLLHKLSTNRSGDADQTANGTVNGKTRRHSSHLKTNPDMIDDGQHAHDIKIQQPRKFVEEEKTETGWTKWRIYKQFLNACGGWPFWLVVVIAFGGYEALLLGRSWILKLWSEQYRVESTSIFDISNHFSTTHFSLQTAANNPLSFSSDDSNFGYYLSLYLGFAVAISIEGTLRYLWIFYGSIKASRKLFQDITHAVLRAPLRWLDTMPVGRVLNRFTADFNTTDGMQAYAFGFSLYNIMLLAGVLVAGVLVSPYIILVAVILLFWCARDALYYISTAREAKRLESIAKSPIFEFFSQALAGVSTLRAFDKSDAYVATMFQLIDSHARAIYYQCLLNRWLSWRLTVIGAIFAVIVASIVINVPGLDASLGGFALGFTLQYSEVVTWVLRNLSQLELGMNATERIIEYSEIDTEDEGGADAPASWPSEGRLSVNDLWVGYAPDLPPVLKGLSFKVNKNERIGVVGRTGAGKSSLTLALFRFLEARKGSIHIDGLDVSKIKLHDLRSRLAIIPQDPVLFSGTVRSNLDPFDEHDDRELLDALERVHLNVSAPPTASGSVTNLASQNTSASASGSTTPPQKNPSLTLSTLVSESGLNLSQGQRQLLCLARAIVSRPKIMVLDEATSAVDKQTDALIQRSIREEFRDSTLIVIAHRLSTIADFDRLLVLDQGTAVEYDTPRALIGKSKGVFKGMVESSGEKDILKEIILGTGDM